jgi:hypothetical protein
LFDLERFSINLSHWHGGDFGSGQGARSGAMQRIASDEQRGTGPKAPRRASGRPKGDDDDPGWSKTALVAE